MSTIMPRRFISRTTCLPKSVSPLCSGCLRGGVGPRRVPGVGEGHVAHPQVEIDAQHRQVGVDRLPAFEAHQDRDPSPLLRRLNLLRRRRHLQHIRVARHFPPHRVDLLQRPANGFGGRIAARVGPQREKQAGDATLAHARNIHLPEIVALGEPVGFVHHHLGGVVVQVQHNGLIQHAPDAPRVHVHLGRGAQPRQQQRKESMHRACHCTMPPAAGEKASRPACCSLAGAAACSWP